MMKKSLLHVLLVLCIPYTMYAMELVQEVEKLANSSEVKDLETKAVGFIQSSTGQGIIKEVEDKAVSFFSHNTAVTTDSSTTTATSTTVPTIVISNPAANTVIAQNNAALNQSSSEQNPLSNSHQTSKTQVPNLHLNNSSVTSTSTFIRAGSSSLPPKTQVRNVDHLKKNVAKVTVQSARNYTPSTQNTPSVSNNDVVIDMGSGQKSVPLSSSQGTHQAHDASTIGVRTYTVQEVWEMIHEVKPELVKFAEENNLSLEQAIVLGKLLKQLNVSPDVVVEHINKNKPSDDKKTVISAAEYKKIQKEKPDKYKEIILEILKDISEEQAQPDGQKAVSPLTDTHIQLLEDQVATEKRDFWIAIGIKVVIALIGTGGVVWGIIGQVTKSTPTSMPTLMPTMFPTGSPT